MKDNTGFISDLEKSILHSDGNLDRNELLEDIFKSYVAKLFEMQIVNKRLPFAVLKEVKRNLISEFRSASLEMYQKSVEQYEELFNKTVQEIVDFAGTRHSGEDVVEDANQVLEVNSNEYLNESAIGSQFTKTAGGIIIPKD